MATHFETIHKHLRDHDWVPDPRHAADDPVVEINTFLNGIIGQESKPSPSAGTEGGGRHVSFELDMPDSPRLSPCSQMPSPREGRSRTIKPITTTKTFARGRCSVAVPWPINQGTGVMDWYATIPVLHHELTRQLLASCSPWTTWIFNSVPASPEDQTWFLNHIHLPIALSAKLSALNSHNSSLRHTLSSFTSSLADTAAAVRILNQAHPQNNRVITQPLWALVPLTLAQRKFSATAEQLILDARQMQDLVTQTTPLVNGLLKIASQSDGLAKDAKTLGLKSPVPGLAPTLPAFLPALQAVSEGLEGFVASITKQTAHLLPAGCETVLKSKGGLLSLTEYLEKGKVDGLLKGCLGETEEWYEEVTKGRSMQGVECGQVFDDKVEAWERVVKLARWAEEAVAVYRGLRKVVGGLEEGVKGVTRSVPICRRG